MTSKNFCFLPLKKACVWLILALAVPFAMPTYAQNATARLLAAQFVDAKCDPNGNYYRNELGKCVMQPKPPTPQQPSSECLVVKGYAPLENDNQRFAERMAIRDAIRSASMQKNLSVRSDQQLENFAMTVDSTRFTSQSRVKSYRILEQGPEAEENDLTENQSTFPSPLPSLSTDAKNAATYAVTLEVCLTEEKTACPNLQGHRYQSRLAVAPVVVENAYEVRDISNVVLGYQQALERGLFQQGQKNLTALHQTIELRANQKITPNLDRELLQSVRNQTEAQYLLLTVIRSASSHEEYGDWANSAKRYYNLEVKDDSRYIEVEWYLVDLMNAKLAEQGRSGIKVVGDVRVGRDRPFATNAFFATATGKAFKKVLAEQVTKVFNRLACQPFESEVIENRDGQYLVLADRTADIRAGDILAVYQQKGRPVRFNGRALSNDFQPGAFLEVTRVENNYVVAKLAANQEVVQIGDRVKAW